MEEKAFKLGYGKFSAMQEQAKQQQSSALQHVNMSFLPRGQKVKHLVSEFGRYMRLGFYHLVTTKLMSTRFLHNLPKGARIVHRKLVNWGEARGLQREWKDEYK